jgi:hypothetical protein
MVAWSQLIRVDARGPTSSDVPSTVYGPVNVLQPLDPEATAPANERSALIAAGIG